MTPDAPTTIAAAALATLAAGALLARVAPRLGWTDAPGPRGGRKLQPAAVPTVGGAALLVGLAVGWWLFDAAGRQPGALTPGRGLGRLVAPGLGAAATLFPFGACCTAFLVGLWDDLVPGGLTPRAKLAGQGLAGAVLGAPLLVSSTVPTSAAVFVLLACVAGAIVATNLINTFDNADGAAGTLGVMGLAGANPLLAAPAAGFLVLNLARRRVDGHRVPVCYLGDAGSHVLGILLLATPAAWPVLLVPALDLARLSVLRQRSGSAPWIGDRRHLSHRFENAGAPRLAVPALLAVVAAPAVVGTALAGVWMAVGVALTTGLFAAALALTRDPGPDRARSLAPAGAPRRGSARAGQPE